MLVYRVLNEHGRSDFNVFFTVDCTRREVQQEARISLEARLEYHTRDVIPTMVFRDAVQA